MTSRTTTFGLIFAGLSFLVLATPGVLGKSLLEGDLAEESQHKATGASTVDAKDAAKWEVELRAMKEKEPQEYRLFVMTVQMLLARFGYITGPFTGVLDEKTRKALGDYQKYRNTPTTGEIDLATFNRLTGDNEILDSVPVSLPSWNEFHDFGDSITASGTWIIENTDQAFPLQTTEIACYRRLSTCFVATARVGDGKLLVVDTEIYEIERWDDYEIVSKPYDYLCTRYVLRLNRVAKVTTAVRSTIRSQEACAGVAPQDFHLRLVDGFEVWQRLDKKKSEAVRQILRIPPQG